jgi:2-iminobutanoate/2-iminopropanoate deaminase
VSITTVFPGEPPAGHYSPGIVHDGVLYVSGQLPIDPATGRKLAGEPIEAQAEQVLKNLDAVLTAAGTSRDRVLRTTIYLTDIGMWDAVNRVYAAFFGAHRPARTIVPTGPLHYGLLIELDAIASAG